MLTEITTPLRQRDIQNLEKFKFSLTLNKIQIQFIFSSRFKSDKMAKFYAAPDPARLLSELLLAPTLSVFF